MTDYVKFTLIASLIMLCGCDETRYQRHSRIYIAACMRENRWSEDRCYDQWLSNEMIEHNTDQPWPGDPK